MMHATELLETEKGWVRLLIDIDELRNYSRPILDSADASQSALTEIEFKI